MASLHDAIREQQEELQGGNAWVAFWKEGRSWHSEAFHLDMGATLYPEDEWRLREIEAADPAAIVLNGYLSEDMTLDELTTSIRYGGNRGRAGSRPRRRASLFRKAVPGRGRF